MSETVDGSCLPSEVIHHILEYLVQYPFPEVAQLSVAVGKESFCRMHPRPPTAVGFWDNQDRFLAAQSILQESFHDIRNNFRVTIIKKGKKLSALRNKIYLQDIGEDFGKHGALFTFYPKEAAINHTILDHFKLSIAICHRIHRISRNIHLDPNGSYPYVTYFLSTPENRQPYLTEKETDLDQAQPKKKHSHSSSCSLQRRLRKRKQSCLITTTRNFFLSIFHS